MTKRINNKLFNNFTNLINNSRNMNNYYNYYESLISFLDKNKKFIRKELFELYNLDFLINLDFISYINKNSSLDLTVEKEYMKRKPESTELLIASISYSLYEMIRLSVSQECTICECELFYSFCEFDNSEKKIVLECPICTNIIDINGNLIKDKVTFSRPANKYDLEKAGIKL